MAQQAIWTGSITMALVNAPVKIYAATDETRVKFNLMHDYDHGRIRMPKVCEDCGETVEQTSIVRGFTTEDDRTVVITDDDIEALPLEVNNSEIEVLYFVPASEIPLIMHDKTYFITANKGTSRAKNAGKGPAKSYQLLMGALESTDMVAVVQVTLRTRTRLATLQVAEMAVGPGETRKLILLHTMLWPQEVRVPDFPILNLEVDLQDAEVKMAAQLVQAMAQQEFTPEAHRDEYTEQVKELIESKLADDDAPLAIAAKPPVEEDDGTDLLAMLEASIKARAAQRVNA